MKKSKAETAETRRKIIETAAQEFRRNGIHATGVSEIMAAAGLSHGGFYRHFESKEQLIAEACAANMDALVESAATAAEGGDASLLKHLREYLSKNHDDEFLAGCPLVAIGSELGRGDMHTRRAASDGFRQLVDIISLQEHDSDPRIARANAMFKLSAMIGALTMSRIVDDQQFADQILNEAKKRLASSPEKLPKKPTSSNKTARAA
jgi:TetR/AcrR family transcriptional repressor of nem operon